MKKILISIFCTLFFSYLSYSQSTDPSRIAQDGKLDDWTILEIKESSVIGGNTKDLYKLSGNNIFAPCNIMAQVMGIVKVSNTLFPEARNNGYCVRMVNAIESIKVFGFINLDVMVQGTLLTGVFEEPVKDSQNTYATVDCGVPYTGHPKALEYDYKAISGNEILRSTGFSAQKKLGIPDYPCVKVLLQRREEHPDGSVTAQRVGTGFKLFKESTSDWVNGDRTPIRYGDLSSDSELKGFGMGLKRGKDAFYCRNSAGKLVPIEEVGWADEGTEPTHLIIWISSSSGEAFHGGPGNTLWVDNIKLIE